MDEIFRHFPEEGAEDADEDVVKVSVIGKPNVGKSSLINRILGEERLIVTNIPGTTRDAIDTYVEKGEKKFIFIDTAGIRRKVRLKKILKDTVHKILDSYRKV